MDASDVIETLPIQGWTGPVTADLQSRAIAALEDGKVLAFALPFALAANETGFLDAGSLDNSRKNISYDPRTGRCNGSGHEGADLAALTAMLRRYGDGAESLMNALFPQYPPALERARTSFRPAEISGRATSPRHDDRRLHVDAFPTRPTHGQRILRVFTNVGTERHWRVGEPFEPFARAFLPRLRGMAPGQAWAMAALGLTKGRRSAYDHAMLGLHDRGKLDDAYQASSPQAAVSFAPGTTWLCFTDQVMHAAMSGRGAFEQTFHLPVQAMARPETAPIRVLERLTARKLA